MSGENQGQSRTGAQKAPGGRLRAYARFIAAVVYFFVARSLARHGAEGLVSDAWMPLVSQAMLAFLLVLGYAAMGFWWDGQLQPVREQGLPLRAGWSSEAGMGVAVGWGLAVACVLPMVVAGGIAIVLVLSSSAWKWLAVDAAYFALATLAEEVAFRGYGFQRFCDAVGPAGATLGFAAYYAVVEADRPGANRATFFVALALGVVLTTAYLRTRALWVSWGLNFAWKASRALVFGLAVSGVSSNSPVVQGNPMGSFWLTGGGYGLDGTWIAFAAMLLLLPVIFRLTRDLDFRYNAPVLEPAGIPVDLDAAARRQHEAAMGASEPGLVQIAASGQMNGATGPGATPTVEKPEDAPAAGAPQER
jgi:CAAX protease family protein